MSNNATQSETLDTQLSSLDFELKTLRRLYEEYFVGVLKRPPEKEHKKFQRMMAKITPDQLTTTPNRFRFQSIKASYVSHNHLWSRSLKEIEGGRFQRDLFLMKHKKSPEQVAPKEKASKADDKLDKLYEQISKVAGGQKLPPKEVFTKSLKQEIVNFKKKNPNKKFEIAIKKNKAGEVQLNLRPKK